MAKIPVRIIRTTSAPTKMYVLLLETEDEGFSIMNYALL